MGGRAVHAILEGKAAQIAASIRRRATRFGYSATERAGADTCADYLTAKKPYLDYHTALASGWPIATGVIEGACRHLVKDRMDITGARWGLDSAEAILRLRAWSATVTSTNTGPFTCDKSTNASTKPATSNTATSSSSPHDQSPPKEPHP